MQEKVLEIENRLDADLEDLLYQMHWPEDMMHKEIGRLLDVSRPTITRWFHELNIPTQSCRRFTDRNLTSWLYKTRQLKKKERYHGPDRRIQRTKGNLNVDFFKHWSPEMAYVLGYFSADGSIAINSGGSKYIHFDSTDKSLLEKVKALMNSRHRIESKAKGPSNKKDIYRLQIGSKEIYEDLLKLGFTRNKALSMRLPKIPVKYLRHFIRGNFDGDGSVSFGYYLRKNKKYGKTFSLLTVFTSGSKDFLEALSKVIFLNANLGPGYLGKKGKGGRLAYSIKDSIKLFHYMYKDVDEKMYMVRKYKKLQEAFKFRGCNSVD